MGWRSKDLRSVGGTAAGSRGSGLAGARGLGTVEAVPWGRSPVLPGLPGPIPDDLGVDGAGDAVVELGVQLGQGVAGVHRCLRDIPDGGGLHDVPDHELPDGLVLGASLGAVSTTNVLDMAAAVLVTASVPTLLGHLLLLL